jgi:hypothetical protein
VAIEHIKVPNLLNVKRAIRVTVSKWLLCGNPAGEDSPIVGDSIKNLERPETRRGEFIETMSFIGACFFMSRERYWELDGLDEKHGSWGQLGTELACKSWLSGGKLLTAKKTWFAHMFRTNNKGFSFPYPITGKQVGSARKYSKHLWLGNNWPKAKYELSWLIDKFHPVPGWEN